MCARSETGVAGAHDVFADTTLSDVDAKLEKFAVDARCTPSGVLEQGKAADIIAVTGDPTKDIHAMKTVVFVIKAGRVLRDSRATEK